MIEARLITQLNFSAGIVTAGDDVLPRFHLRMANGAELLLLCEMEDGLEARTLAFAWLGDLFRWLQVTSFEMAAETIDPPTITCVHVSRNKIVSVMQPINPNVGVTGDIEISGGENVGAEILALLPRGYAEIGKKRLQEC